MDASILPKFYETEFSPIFFPDEFLREIKPIWERISKKTKFYLLIFIVIRNIIGCDSENLNELLYRQVILQLDKESEGKPLFGLLPQWLYYCLINFFIINKIA